jgi:hypothetical protein
MNIEDAIRMAQDAGLIQEWMVLSDDQKSKLIAFAAAMYEKGMDDGAADFERIMLPALIAVEREACAKTAEDFLTRGRSPFGYRVAEAIRARNKE